MHSSNVSTHGMAVAPHHLASQSALAILREGGSAIEAMVAAAAAIAVVYPHMNGLGGDGFWLIVPPEGDPIAIDASGAAGSLATPQAYAGLAQIPHRGPQAALTVAARKASTSNVATTIAARRTTVAAARPRTSARYARSSTTTTANSAVARRRRRMCAWSVAGRCPTATTANASTTAPWRACRFTRVTNGAVRARTWC